MGEDIGGGGVAEGARLTLEGDLFRHDTVRRSIG
jgi:hypothetical protein